LTPKIILLRSIQPKISEFIGDTAPMVFDHYAMIAEILLPPSEIASLAFIKMVGLSSSHHKRT
jgi:hypothetical protein